MAQQLVSLADDYTEFNGGLSRPCWSARTCRRRDGRHRPYDKAMYSDMQNARVQVYGDTAILTYNFAGIRAGADGKSKPALGEVDSRLCEGGRQVDAGPRQLRARSRPSAVG